MGAVRDSRGGRNGQVAKRQGSTKRLCRQPVCCAPEPDGDARFAGRIYSTRKYGGTSVKLLKNNSLRKYFRATCALTVLCLLAACVSTRVTGQRVGTVDGKISRIGVYVQPDQFTGGMAAFMGNKDLKTLLP